MVDAVQTTTSNNNSTSQAASTGLVANYDLFLTLLTTQVQNQDPLDPLDSAEYTNQLVQYASVEQSIQTNSYLQDMFAALEASRASSYVSYLGTDVIASGDTTMLEGGSATWNYSLSDDASGKVEIKNSAGAVVFSEDVELSKGEGSYTWDGVGSSGVDSSEGAYTITFDLKGSNDKAVTVATEIQGRVEEVDLSTGSAFLQIGDVRVPVSAVKSVK